MSTQINFDATAVKPAVMGSSAIPVSDNLGHLVVIYDDEVVGSANNPNNGVLNLKVKIIEGEHNGAEGVYRINYFWNGEDEKSKTTKRIADAQLSAICHAVNVHRPQNIAELYNKPFRIVVELQKGEEAAEKGYTQIKGVLCADGGVPGFPDKPKVQRQTQAAAPAAGSTWQPASQQAPPVQEVTTAPTWGQPSAPVEQPVVQQEAAQPAWGNQTAQTMAGASAPPPWAVPK